MRSVVVLLEGDVSELPLLTSAAALREMIEAPVETCWVEGPHQAARGLLAELAGDTRLRQVEPRELVDRLRSDQVRSILMSQSAWARHAGHLWNRLGSCSIYVHRHGVGRPRRLVCCADTPQTASGLLARIAVGPWIRAEDVAVVHAQPPPPGWVQSLCMLNGVPLPPPEQPRFALTGSGQANVLIDASDPEAAVRSACLALEPDLVVLGWHRHQIPLPCRWQHPTAWRLSTRLPHDVLLVPLTA
jgi:hypothetical protein